MVGDGHQRDHGNYRRRCHEGTHLSRAWDVGKCLREVLEARIDKRGLKVVSQVLLPVLYDGVEIEGGYKIDLLVEDRVVVELKVVEHVLEVHKAQLLSYLKLSGHSVGLLINFNVVHLRDGIKRLVNHFNSSASLASSAIFS